MAELQRPTPSEVLLDLKSATQEERDDRLKQLQKPQLDILFQCSALTFEPTIHPPSEVLNKWREITNDNASERTWVQWHLMRCEGPCKAIVENGGTADDDEERQEWWKVMQAIIDIINGPMMDGFREVARTHGARLFRRR